ncbi:MAG: nucleoside-diphosphate sugar epimerase/dehydratase, partial [bacterium]|nr:nucleoside-diphosphate sugar epimerase/dehydratase [bacterium]
THDVVRLIQANLISSLFFGLAVFSLKSQVFPYPRSAVIINFMLSTIFTTGLRYIEKYILHSGSRAINKAHPVIKALIIGAGEAGSMVLREIRNHPDSRIKVMGFIDDDPLKLNMFIAGKKVLGSRDDILKWTEKKHIQMIIIAIPSANRKSINDIIEICEKAGVQLKIVPSTFEIIAGNVRFEQIRDIKIEELLSRDEIKLNLKEIEQYLRHRVILVTGAGGSIGSEICRQVARAGIKKVILLGKGENSIFTIHAELKRKFPDLAAVPVIADVRDPEKIERVFREYKPQVVFHAAAHKHVYLMELYPDEAIKNNILGTLNLVQASVAAGTERFVLISTDKAVNPESVMGMSKRIAEKLLIGHAERAKRSGCRLMAVRFGNVLGSRGSVVPIFKEQIEAGGPVTVTHPDVKRYFMTIPEAVQLVLQAGGYGRGGEVFLLKMGNPVRILDLARKMIGLSGYIPDKDIRIKFTGLKAGEKLNEDLVVNSEKVDATQYDKIMVARSEKTDIKDLIRKIEKMKGQLYKHTSRELKTWLKGLV